MKSFTIALAFGAALVAAQDLSALPKCGQLCVGNMLGQAQALGCSPSDYKCLCSNNNFGYGVRDCSNAACSSSSDAAAVISFGTAFCQAQGINSVGGQSAGASATSAAPSAASAGASAGSAGASGASSTAASAASSAIASVSSAAASHASAASSLASAASSLGASATSAASAASSKAASAASGASSAASAGASSATSAAGAAMATAAPLAGAGIMAILALL